MLHSAEECNGIHTNRTIKYVMRGSVGSRVYTVKHYNKSKKKWKKDLKYLKKQNKILYSIDNKLGSRREIKNIKKTR